MRAGRNLGWIKDPTKTTNSSGMWNLNEINNHINNGNWPKLNESPNQYNLGAAYINYISQGLKPRYDIGAAYLNLAGTKNPNLHLGQTYLNVAVNSIDSADFTTPSAPSNVVPSIMGLSGGKYVSLDFTAPSGPITNYLVQFSTDNGSTWTSVSKPISAGKIELLDLAPKTSHVFRVAAANYAGTSSYSSQSSSITTGNNFPYATLGHLRGQFTAGADTTQMTNGNLLTFPITGDQSSIYSSISYSLGTVASYGFIAIGYFVPPTTGTYTFFTSSDDGSAVWVGDIAEAVSGRNLTNAVLNNNATGTQGNIKRNGSTTLNAGTAYAIRIVHRTIGGGENLTFSWSGPGISETTNLSQYFYGINSF
jgi:hypothetical protein